MTAELAGLEERRRGAEAAFQRIDRLHADLERRVLAIEQQRALPRQSGSSASVKARSWRSASKELAAARAEALAQAQTIAAQAQELRHQLATMETQLKTARAALDQLREIARGRSSEVAKLRSDLEHLEASCLAEVNVEAAVLRADAEIARLAVKSWRPKRKPAATLRQKH